MGCFGEGMPPPKHPKHSFYGIAHAPQVVCNCPAPSHDLPPTFILTDIIGASAVIRRTPTELCIVDSLASKIKSITIIPYDCFPT